MGFLQRQTELTTFLGLLPHSFLSPSTASGKSVVSSVAFRTTTDDEMAEVQGIEPSTLRWHGFQDRLSTLLAYLQKLYEGSTTSHPQPHWSEMQDSNLRPSAPKADALPDCANLRISGPSTRYRSLVSRLSVECSTFELSKGIHLVDPAGFEPTTCGLKDRCSTY